MDQSDSGQNDLEMQVTTTFDRVTNCFCIVVVCQYLIFVVLVIRLLMGSLG